MFEWLYILLLTLLAGLAMPLGGALASIPGFVPDWLDEEFRHSVTAFGAGALLSAVALVLVPEGIPQFDTLMVAVLFLSGGVAFMVIDILLYRYQTSASQLVAMLTDFIPESIALGASLALGGVNSLLLALLIAMQNIPEGFNAFREIKESGRMPNRRIILLFTMLAFTGPIAALCAYFWLAQYEEFVAGLMLFAAGGILYAVFQDIASQVRLERHWGPPLGAVMGFMLGIIGYMLT